MAALQAGAYARSRPGTLDDSLEREEEEDTGRNIKTSKEGLGFPTLANRRLRVKTLCET